MMIFTAIEKKDEPIKVNINASNIFNINPFLTTWSVKHFVNKHVQNYEDKLVMYIQTVQCFAVYLIQ